MPRIDRVATALARRHDLDLDDVRSEMLLAILERAHTEPDFPNQTDAYIVQYGAWQAQHAAQRQHIYQRYCPSLDEDATELVPHHEPSPEEAIINSELDEERAARCRHVRDVVATLTGNVRTVADGLLAGHRRKDIAAGLGITPQAVGHYYRRLATALAT